MKKHRRGINKSAQISARVQEERKRTQKYLSLLSERVGVYDKDLETILLTIVLALENNLVQELANANGEFIKIQQNINSLQGIPKEWIN